MLMLFAQSAAASDSIENLGTALQVLLPATAFGATFYVDDKEGRMEFYKSFFTNLAVTEALKYTVHEMRPDHSDDHSFPSGHTSAAFQGAAFIHERYGLDYGIPAYLLASFVGYSRIEANRHSLEDVLAGAALGIASSYYFTEPYKGVTVTPLADRDSFGILLTARW